jgi:hypothetical protein
MMSVTYFLSDRASPVTTGQTDPVLEASTLNDVPDLKIQHAEGLNRYWDFSTTRDSSRPSCPI